MAAQGLILPSSVSRGRKFWVSKKGFLGVRLTGLLACRCKWYSWFKSFCSGVKYSAVSGVCLQLVVCWEEPVFIAKFMVSKNFIIKTYRRPNYCQVVASGIPGVQPLFRSNLALQQVLLQLVVC